MTHRPLGYQLPSICLYEAPFRRNSFAFNSWSLVQAIILLAPKWHGLSLTIFELFSWLQYRFLPPARPTMMYDKYRSISYRFVERQERVLTHISNAAMQSGNFVNWKLPNTSKRETNSWAIKFHQVCIDARADRHGVLAMLWQSCEPCF